MACRPILKQNSDASGIQNVKSYTLLQGSNLESRGIRLQRELQFIQIAGSASINIARNTTQKGNIRFSSDPFVKNPTFIQRTKPWFNENLGTSKNSIFPSNEPNGSTGVEKNQ